MQLGGVRAERRGEGWYLSPESFGLGHGFNRTSYLQLAASILAHGRQHLSASAMAAHVLRTMQADRGAASTPASWTAGGVVGGTAGGAGGAVLFITHCSEDFTADSLLFGFMLLLGPDLVTDAAFDTDGMAHPWCEAPSPCCASALHHTTLSSPAWCSAAISAGGGGGNVEGSVVRCLTASPGRGWFRCSEASRSKRKKPSLRSLPPPPTDGSPPRFSIFGRSPPPHSPHVAPPQSPASRHDPPPLVRTPFPLPGTPTAR